MIPGKDRTEWQQLIRGKLNFKFKNYVLQLTVHQLYRDYNEAKIGLDEAVDQLHSLCSKYQLAVNDDLKKIFKDYNN